MLQTYAGTINKEAPPHRGFHTDRRLTHRDRLPSVILPRNFHPTREMCIASRLVPRLSVTKWPYLAVPAQIATTHRHHGHAVHRCSPVFFPCVSYPCERRVGFKLKRENTVGYFLLLRLRIDSSLTPDFNNPIPIHHRDQLLSAYSYPASGK